MNSLFRIRVMFRSPGRLNDQEPRLRLRADGGTLDMKMKRRHFLSVAAAAPAIWASGGLAAQDPEKKKAARWFREITLNQVRAVDRGLAWLARNQFATGAIGTTCPVAFTSLAGLAFMANNSTPYHGKYAKNVRKCLKYILHCSSRSDGYINESSGSSSGRGSRMHGHGYATWFLAELYGMCGAMLDLGDDEVRERLQLAVRVIENSQSARGGWTYAPIRSGDEGSVTITQVQALRSARNCGLKVGKPIIDKGIDYIKKSTHTDGTVAYSLGSRRSGGTYPLTAAGMCVFAMYGMYDSPELKRGLKAMMQFLVGGRSRRGSHEYYAHLYAAQACFFSKRIDPEYWTKGFETIRKELLDKQGPDGSWRGRYGGAFATACATLVLQIPYRYLPIFQD